MSDNPTMHKPVPMGEFVKIPEYYKLGSNMWGTVGGIASMHVVFSYIVVFKEKQIHPSTGEPLLAVVVLGTELEGENGKHWRLET